MLVLSRNRGESIVIDGNIRITVLDVRGQSIRLGFEAPRHIEIQRSELLEKQQATMPELECVPQRRSA